MNKKQQQIFDSIKRECNHRLNKPLGLLAFDMFFGLTNVKRSDNFHKRTVHENIFHLLYPKFKMQVHFGTGKGGLEKYGTKRFTVDFYDEENDVIYEIDGENHKNELQQLKDEIRDYFFFHELGVRTIRISNEQVERMLSDRIKLLDKEGAFGE